jgi:hypothetical protein
MAFRSQTATYRCGVCHVGEKYLSCTVQEGRSIYMPTMKGDYRRCEFAYSASNENE